MEMISKRPQRGELPAGRKLGLAIGLVLVALALILGATPADAGAPCSAVSAPMCNGGCEAGFTCRAQGDVCVCLQNCGDGAACDGTPGCPPGFECTIIGTLPCVCVPPPTPTPTLTPTSTTTPTVTPTSPSLVAPVPAVSTNGLVLALLLLAVVGVVAINWRSRRSPSH
jgi:hypothetical protein